MKFLNSSPCLPSLIRFFLVMSCLVILQFPFLTADADYHLAGSRGPFTDEALYTAQFRNYKITGHLELAEMDGIVKEPLFAAGMWLVSHFFGDSMFSFRLAITLSAAFLIAILTTGSRSFARTVLIALPLSFFSFYIFQYGHLAMAEILCSIIILATCRILHDHLMGLRGWWRLLISNFLIFLAYILKVQFIYCALIPSITICLAILLRLSSGNYPNRGDWINLIYSILFACAFVVIYYFAWIAPHYELWVATVLHQVGERTTAVMDIPKIAYGQLLELLLDVRNWPMLLLIPFGLTGVWREWSQSATEIKRRQAWIGLMAPLLTWFVFELHKLSLPYLPTRYLVSFYLSIAMITAAGLSMFKKPNLRKTSLWFRIVGATAIILSIFANIIFYQHALQDRTFSVRDAQIFFAASEKWRGKVVIGPWAPTLFWGTGAITIPVWKDYFNDLDIIAKYHPSVLVSEVDQQDSNGAFAADGINLKKLPSTVVYVRKWEIHIYVIPSS